MSGDQLDLDAIVEKANMPGHVTFPAGAELLALVAEVRRLREERAAIDLMDWPGEAHRLQAALHFARGTINDMAATIERLENEARHDG